MQLRRHHALLMAATAVGLSAWGISFSDATFTSTSRSTATVQAASDWTPPAVTLASPGATVKGTTTLSVTASDANSGIKSVTVQFYDPASGWRDICTTTTSPYACAWDTTKMSDGSYTLRAIALDNAGYSTTSASVSTTVANNLVVSLADPGDVVKGSVPLTTTLYGAGTTTYTVSVQYAPSGGSAWTTISTCSKLASPYSCTWDTSSSKIANGSYDLRSVATAGTATTTSAIVSAVLVDNAAPTVTMLDPGSPLSGTTTFSATADDADSGIASVTLQYQLAGTTTWTTLCSAANTSGTTYSCSYDTAKLTSATASYSFRAIATDNAANTTTSTAVTGRTVDNTVSSVTMSDPGAALNGTVTLAASPSSSAGVTSVRIQRAVSGSGTWTDVCTATSSPYQCSWNTTTVADGLYDLRAILTDGAGKITTSAVVTQRRVDNTALRGFDVQTANGGAAVGKIELGDSITFTYTDQVAPSSIVSGWTGTARAVTVRVRDGGLLSPKLSSKDDTLDVQVGGATINLGSVNLRDDYVKGSQTATVNATMTAGTKVVNGVTATTITIQFGSIASNGGSLKTAGAANTMVWTPSASAMDLTGHACSATAASETGALDKEF